MTPEKEIEILKWLVENYPNYGTSYAGVWELIKIINHYHESEVKKLNEPDVSVNEAFGFRRGVAGCPLCNGRGEYHTGGSFGGEVQIHQCECTKGQTEH